MYAAAHEPGSIDEVLKGLGRTDGVSIRGIVIPPDPGQAAIRRLPLSDSTVVLTPLLVPDARPISNAFPDARIVLIGGTEDSKTTVRFDRSGAMSSAGEAFGRYLASRHATGRSNAGGGAWALFLADTAGRRSDLESFRRGVAAADGPEAGDKVHYLTYTVPPDRDELRSVIQEAKGAHAVGYALFVGSGNSYCMDLLAGTDSKVVLPDLMGTEAYGDRILCSVEEPLRSAVNAVIRAGKKLPPEITVPAVVVYPAGSAAPAKF